MIDAMSLVDRLSTYTLGGLVTIILIGSYFKIWLWYSTYLEMKTDLLQQLAEEKKAKQRWEDAALAAAGRLDLVSQQKRTTP